MKYVYLDMDGVLCDFHKKYQLLFDITAQEAKAANRKKYRELWDDFLDMQAFTTLDWYPGGEELIEYMRTLDPKKVQIAILSSAGGFDRQREVQEQKLLWLSRHLIDWPAIIVPGRRYKAGFARPDSIIIDDTQDVITSFVAAGGNAIHHHSWENTKPLLDFWLRVPLHN